MDCQTMKAQLPELLPDLLLDPKAVPAGARQHIAGCAECKGSVESELAAHEATMQLLNHWEAPEVSPYFHSRMAALLREEQARERPGWLERLRSWVELGNFELKPVYGAAALGVLLAIGGGAYLDLNEQAAPVPTPQASAIVRDLQSLDENAQVFQQMNSLDAPDGDGSSSHSL